MSGENGSDISLLQVRHLAAHCKQIFSYCFTELQELLGRKKPVRMWETVARPQKSQTKSNHPRVKVLVTDLRWYFLFSFETGLVRKKKGAIAEFASVYLCTSVCGQCSEAFKTHWMASSSLNYRPVCWTLVEAVRGERFWCVDTMCGHSGPRQHLVWSLFKAAATCGIDFIQQKERAKSTKSAK